MGLSITRRRGETFTVTYPDGEVRTIECVDIQGQFIKVDGRLRNCPMHLIGGVVIRAQNQRSDSQCKFHITAPRDVKIMRDDAKQQEKRA